MSTRWGKVKREELKKEGERGAEISEKLGGRREESKKGRAGR
jgi:hypothetical protein